MLPLVDVVVLAAAPSCMNILTAHDSGKHSKKPFIVFLDLKLLILIVLREPKMKSAAFGPIDFNCVASLEFFDSSACGLVLAQETAHQPFSTDLLLPARDHKSKYRALDALKALLFRRDRLESALRAEGHGCVAAHAEHLFVNLAAGRAGRCLEAVCRLEDHD